MRDSKLYPFTIPANGSVTLLTSGDYFKVKSSTGSLTVIGDTFGNLSGLLAGQGLRDTNFSRLTLVDETGAQNSGFLLVSDGTFIDDRVTGEVSVIDGELAKTKSGNSYIAFASILAVAAQNSYLELFNPAGSNKRLIISDIVSSSSSVAAAAINKITATMGAAAVPYTKLFNGSASTAISKTAGSTNTIIPGVTIENQFINAYTPYARQYKQPITIDPGFGIVVWNTQANSNFVSAIQFTEDPV